MRYRKWDERLIKTQLKQVLSEYGITQNEDLILDSEIFESLLHKKITPFQSDCTFEEKMEDDISSFILFEPFFDELEKFASYKKYLHNNGDNELNGFRITYSQLCAFTHDFYLSLDPEIFRYFNHVFKERRHNLKFSHNRSIEIYSPSCDYAYINVEKTGTIQDFININHEYMHAVCDRIKFRPNCNTNYPFNELAPLFIEFLTLDLLNELFECDSKEAKISDDINAIKANTAAYILKDSKNILIEATYLSQLDSLKEENDTIYEMAKITKTGLDTVTDIMSTTSYEKYIYSIAYITAIELYYLYKEDPELALYKLKQIILLEKKDNYYEELLNMNIHINKHSKKYLKSIKI